MRDFYRADQEEEDSFPSLPNRIKGLLSRIRGKFPDQIPAPRRTKIIKRQTFYGSKKSMEDSVKYCHVDPRIDYMRVFLKNVERQKMR